MSTRMTKTAGAGQIPISHSWENRWKPPDGSVILSAMARPCKTLHPTWKAISQDLPPVLWTYVCSPTEEAAPRTRFARDVANPDDQPVDHLQGIIWCRAEDVGRDVGRDVGDWVCQWHAKRLCDGVSYGLGWALSYGIDRKSTRLNSSHLG